jgi:NAD(P)-dependent dehydrogenase (short-subunit alcohol dehydrogenase family)
MNDFSGQYAIVFGGESGIGGAASALLASRGCRVLIAGVLTEQAEQALHSIQGKGGEASFLRADVRDRAAVLESIRRASSAEGRLDILVYSSGVYDGYASALETSEQLWDQVLEINLKGCLRACQAVLPGMVAQGYGRIVTVASVASYIGTADGLAYTVSKSGMLGMVRHIGTTYADRGITMNAVCPGVISTSMRANSQRVLGDLSPPMERGIAYDPESYKAFVPAKRRGETSEVGELIAFLASRSAGYITGQGVTIDGGWIAA